MRLRAKRRATPDVSDEELVLVAAVATREGWRDLASPPADQAGPRTLAEAAAVSRYAVAAAARRTARPRNMRMRARVAMLIASIVVLGICWWVSPTRTAIALLGVGAVSLIALTRGRRRAARASRAARALTPR